MHTTHTPNAHISKHGNVASKMGAMPTATNQLQLRARPATTTTSAKSRSAVRLPRYWRTAERASRGRDVVSGLVDWFRLIAYSPFSLFDHRFQPSNAT